jgi:hypothetical protein
MFGKAQTSACLRQAAASLPGLSQKNKQQTRPNELTTDHGFGGHDN